MWTDRFGVVFLARTAGKSRSFQASNGEAVVPIVLFNGAVLSGQHSHLQQTLSNGYGTDPPDRVCAGTSDGDQVNSDSTRLQAA